MRVMRMLRLPEELRRWCYLAQHADAGAVLEIPVRSLILRVHVDLVVLAASGFSGVTTVMNVYLPSQIAMCETLNICR